MLDRQHVVQYFACFAAIFPVLLLIDFIFPLLLLTQPMNMMHAAFGKSLLESAAGACGLRLALLGNCRPGRAQRDDILVLATTINNLLSFSHASAAAAAAAAAA